MNPSEPPRKLSVETTANLEALIRFHVGEVEKDLETLRRLRGNLIQHAKLNETAEQLQAQINELERQRTAARFSPPPKP